MKKIEAIIRPEKFPLLRKKLGETGINGLTVTEAAGCGLQEGETGVFRGTKYEINLFPKIKVEMVVTDERVEDIISLVQDVCSSGNVGDGKIFIIPVENVVRIRSGESGIAAITS